MHLGHEDSSKLWELTKYLLNRIEEIKRGIEVERRALNAEDEQTHAKMDFQVLYESTSLFDKVEVDSQSFL